MEINEKDLQDVIDKFDTEESATYRISSMEMQFVKNLIKERKKQKITQRDLASKTGLTQQVISSIEKLDRKPTLPNLIKYLDGLGIDINKLFE